MPSYRSLRIAKSMLSFLIFLSFSNPFYCYPTIRIMGHGTSSCGSYTSSPLILSATYDAWILGYLTARFWSEKISSSSDNEGYLQWIRNYCQNKPLDSIYDASEQLVIHLERK
jgi:hypothetical protein